MAKRLLRLHLSSESRDFGPIALEPGLPLLDKAGGADKIMRKWLGRLAAQPEWDSSGPKDSVSLFVCDDEGRRLVDVDAEPATAEDLRRNPELKKDFDDIARRLKEATPATPTETKVLDVVSKHWKKLTTETLPQIQECYFFKYRVGKSWRLVWGWGYRRTGEEPAPPTICTNPTCELLYVKRDKASKKCPACESEQLAKKAAAPPKKGGLALPLTVAAVVLLAIIGGGLGYYFWPKPPLPVPDPGKPPVITEGLAVTPDKWTGPIDGKVQFVVQRTDKEGKVTDLSNKVVAVVEHPRIARIEKGTTSVLARAPGATVVRFYFGKEETRATLTVEAGDAPTKLSLDPDEVKLGLGTTSQLKLIGHYKDGALVDLSAAADWQPTEGAVVYGRRGLLEGLAVGTATVTAKYRAPGAKTDLEATASVKVKEEQYESLRLTLEPESLAPGQVAKVGALLATKSGETRSAIGSSQLKIEIEPADLAQLSGDALTALHSGQGKLSATYKSLSGEAQIKIEGSSEPSPFEVTPKDLALLVGEISDLSIPEGEGAVEIATSSPSVEVLANRRVVGRKAGTAVLTVKRGADKAEVAVEVKEAKFTAIAIVPERVEVPVDDNATLRVVGKYASADGGELEAELAPDLVSAEQLPVASYVDFDVATLTLRGVRPTDGAPQLIALRVGEHSAAAAIHVKLPPLTIDLEPAGTQQLPVGQSLQLRTFAGYGGRRVELLPDRLEFRLKPEKVAGLEFDPQTGVVSVTDEGKGPLAITAVYQGNVSNSVEVSSVPAKPVTLVLAFDRELLIVGDTGQIAVQGGLSGVTFESGDAKLLALDPTTGFFRAEAPGDLTITASHASASSKAELKFKIVAADEIQLVLRPDNIKLGVGNRAEVKLFATSGGVEVEIPLAGETSDVQLAIARPEDVAWEPPALSGLALAEPFEITATYRGKTAKATVEVVASTDEKGAVPELRVVPSTVTLAPGQPLSPRVEQKLPGEGDNWAEVEPQRVRWKVPSEITWTPPTEDLRPRALVGAAAKGSLTIEAEFGGKTARLVVNLGPPPSRDEGTALVVAREPEGESIAVGQRQRYTILQTSGGKQVPAAGVKWERAFENEFASWQPSTLAGLKAGHVQTLRAKVGEEIVSFETRIEGESALPSQPVVGVGQDSIGAPPPSGELVVSPRVVRLQVGESKQLGTDVSVVRGGVNVSRLVEVVSADPGIARYDADTGAVVGIAPGRARFAVTHDDQRALFGVLVTPFAAPANGTITIEPSGGAIAVGEGRGLRVYLVAPSGEKIDRTSAASLVSSVPAVLDLRGSRALGISGGTADVSASLPGVQGTASATFTVGEQPFSRLIVTPAQMRIGVGEDRQFRVFAVGPEGRVELSEHPKLQLSVAGPNAEAIELGGLGTVRGRSTGNASVEVKWDGKLSDKLLVSVSDEPLTNLRIEPARMTIGVGEQQSYLVFARRGDSEQALSADDGVELRVSDGSVARGIGGLTVEGLRSGNTQVIALYNRQRASARLTVAGGGGLVGSGFIPGSSVGIVGPGVLNLPPSRVLGLRFSPEILRLPLGAPGAPVQVLRVYSDGHEEDVSSLAKVVVRPREVVEVQSSASGSAIHALSVGRAQAFAQLKTDDGELRELRPLAIEVSAFSPARAVLEARPSPLTLEVGEVAALSRVQLFSDRASTPLDVDYRLEAPHSRIAAVENGRQLRGIAPGTVQVVVHPAGVAEPLAALATSITVHVVAPAREMPLASGASLVLTGPSRTSVGAEVGYRVELVSGGLTLDVTNEAASLVIDRDQLELAEARPGCRLLAKKSGTASVRAQYRDLISNAVVVRIDAIAERFARLELEIDRRPLAVGEAREYRVWGVPGGDAPRQELTSQVGVDPAGLIVQLAGEAATHAPPLVTGTSPGNVTLEAIIAGAQKSNLVELAVVPTVATDDLLLSVEPAAVTIRVGERSPRLSVLGRRPGELSGRSIPVRWESLDPAICEPASDSASQILAKAVGATQIKATVGSQIVVVDVHVVGGRFTTVTREKDPRFFDNESTFEIGINVSAIAPGAQLEYRVVGSDEASATAWTAGVANGDTISAALVSPKMKKGPFSTVYHVTLESRDKKDGSIERYPCTFRMVLTTQ